MKRILLLLLIITHVGYGQADHSMDSTSLPMKTDFKFGLISELSTAAAFGFGNLLSYRSFLKANQAGPSPGPDQFINFGLAVGSTE